MNEWNLEYGSFLEIEEERAAYCNAANQSAADAYLPPSLDLSLTPPRKVSAPLIK